MGKKLFSEVLSWINQLHRFSIENPLDPHHWIAPYHHITDMRHTETINLTADNPFYRLKTGYVVHLIVHVTFRNTSPLNLNLL